MKPNTATRRKKTNPNVVTYQKTFTNFNDCFHELIKVPNIERVLCYAKIDKIDEEGNVIERYYDNSTMLLSDAIYAISTYLSQPENTPYLLGKKNIHTQSNISANRCFIKTEDSIGFGWSIKYHLEDNIEENSRRPIKQAIIDQVFGTIIFYNKNVSGDDIDILEQNGWNLKVEESEEITE